MKIRPVGAELSHADGRTDRQNTMTKLIVTFRKFANAPKNLEAISKFWAPEGWHKASSIPRTRKYKIYSSRQPDARDFCTPDQQQKSCYKHNQTVLIFPFQDNELFLTLSRQNPKFQHAIHHIPPPESTPEAAIFTARSQTPTPYDSPLQSETGLPSSRLPRYLKKR